MTKKIEKLEIINECGFHARPAALFAQTAGTFAAEITLKNLTSGGVADGKSLMSLLMLAASKGTSLELTVDGPDADAAFAELAKMIREGFDEI